MSASINPAIYFVDATLADLDTLLAGLPEGAEVHLIDPGADGVQLLADTLAGRSGVGAIHLLSHGSAGSFSLGSSTVNSTTLAHYDPQWATIRAALADNADLLIYGCDVAAGETGQAFVAQLSELIGADVAASEDATGAAVWGGDWDLEVATGAIEAKTLAITGYSGLLELITKTITASSSPQTVSGVGYFVEDPALEKVFLVDLDVTDAYNFYLTNGDNLTTSRVIEDNIGLDTTNQTGGQISWGAQLIGTWNTVGTYDYSYQVQLIGGGGLIRLETANVRVTVQSANTAPAISGTTTTVQEGVQGSVNLHDWSNDNESFDSALTYEWISGVGSVSGNTLTYTPSTDASKKGDSYTNESTVVKVTDPEGLTAQTTFYWNVNYADDPTVWGTPPSNQTWNTAGSKSYAWNSGASDPDDTVSYSFQSVNGGTPSWMSTGTTISGNPGASFANATYTINVRATGSNNVDRSFTIALGTAEQINDAPTTSGYSKTINEDAAYTFAATDFPFTDLDLGTLYNTRHSIKITSLPTNAALKLDNVDVTANQVILVADIPKLVITPTANYNGSTTFGFQVSDGLAWSSTSTMTLNVTAVNDAPVLTGTSSNMTGITEDATSNGGQLVSALLAIRTDADTTIGSPTHGNTNGLLEGMAIHSTTVSGPADGGKWQYKIGTGSWTDFGTLSETEALLLKSNDSIRFLPDGKNGQIARFNYHAWDQATGTAGDKVSVIAANRGGTTAFSIDDDSVSITVSDVNDAPTIAKPATQTVNEDASIGITGISFGDVDIVDRNDTTDNNGITVTLSVSHGILTLAGTTDVTFDAGADGSASMKISGTLAAINTAVATLTYAPDENYSGSDTLNIDVDDQGNVGSGGALTANDTLAITVTPVNDAPVLVNGVPELTSRTEDDTTNNGNLVSDLLAGTTGGSNPGDKTGRTDVDTLNNGGAGNPPEAVGQGIAIHTTSNTGPADGGTWQYSIDGGTNWTAIGSVSSSSALLLAATDKVRFVPDGENATSASISFYAWDQATGTRGTKVDPGTRGGSTAFSLSTDTATISVTPVNDAPTLDLDLSAGGTGFSTTFLPRGSEVAIVDVDVTIRDVDQNDRTDVTQQDRISQAVITLSTGAADNYPGQTDETLTFKNGGVATASWNGLTITGNGSTAVTITGVATWATYQDALQKVVYNNANPNPTTGDRTVTVVVTDNDDTGAQANKLPSATATTIINVPGIAVVDMNGNLTGADHTVTYTEGDAGKMLSTTDGRIDNLGGNNLKTVVMTLSNPLDGTTGDAESLFVDAATITSLATDRGITVTGSGTYTVTLSATNSGLGVTANNMNVALRAVQYKNTSDAPSVTPRVVDVTVEDIQRAGVGAKSTITVVPVNDAPVISVNTPHTVLEGGLLTLSTANLNATDIDDDDATLDFVITTAPTKGVLFRDANGNNIADSGEVLAATAGTGVITSFTQADLAAGIVKYQQTDTAAASVTDYVSDSFDFKVQDGMENGVEAPTGTASLTITPVNDAPTLTATASSPTFTENPTDPATSDWAVLFSAASLSPVENTQFVSEVTLTVSNVSNGDHELLRVDGQEVILKNGTGTTPTTSFGYTVVLTGTTATVTLSKASTLPDAWATLLNGLAYRNTSNAPSTLDRVVTLTSVKDNGGVTNGGIETTTLSIASTVSISASDSAPTLDINTGATVANGGLLGLSTTLLDTNDTDTADTNLVYTVTTATAGGTLFKDIYNNGDAELNPALVVGSTFTQQDIVDGKIKYRHNGDNNDPDSFDFTVSDGTTTLTAASFALTIAATGTTPVISGTGSTSANATDGGDVLFSGVSIAPPVGNTIKSLTFAVTGAVDGISESLVIGGQQVPLTGGSTITNGDITYTVVDNGNGKFSVTVTDTTAPGWDATGASALVNGMGYRNDASPAQAGQRTVTLDSVTDMTAAGTANPATDTDITATTTVNPMVDVFSTADATNAIPTPDVGKDFQSLSFKVTGVKDGASEILKVNGVEVPLVAGTNLTVDGVTYTVTTDGSDLRVTMTDPTAPALSESAAEAIVDGVMLINTAATPTTGARSVTLDGVTQANISDGTAPVVTDPDATTNNTYTVSSVRKGDVVNPLGFDPIPNIDDAATVSAFTFTVDKLYDDANEVLIIGGQEVPLVAGTIVDSSGTYTITYEKGAKKNEGGKATVVFTPASPLNEADAGTLVTGVQMKNTSTPPTTGQRDVALTSWTVNGTPTPVTGVGSSVVVNGQMLIVLDHGKGTKQLDDADLSTPTANNKIKQIELGVTGANDNDVLTINNQEIALVNGSQTIDGVTYTVSLDASGNGTVTLTGNTEANGWNEAQTENILDNMGVHDSAGGSVGASVKVNGILQAPDTNWSSTTPLTPLPVELTGSAVPGAVFSPLAGDTFTVTGGSTVDAMTFQVSGVQTADVQEILRINGQDVVLTDGTNITDADGNTYAVTITGGVATVVFTPATNLGSAAANALAQGVTYRNTDTTPTAGERIVSLVSIVEDTGSATSTKPIANVSGSVALQGDVALPTIPSGTALVDLFNGVDLVPPGDGNTYQSLKFAVSGIQGDTQEILTVNGKNIPLTNGFSTTIDGVTYTVTLNGSGAGFVTVTDNSAPGFTETQAEALVNNATYANTDSTPSAGIRSVSLTETKTMNGSGATVATTPISGISTSFNSGSTSGGTLPMAGETLTVTSGSTVDSLTFEVTGVKDGAYETLTFGTAPNTTQVPLVPGTYAGANPAGSYQVRVDAAGKATVVFTPTANLDAAAAQTLVQGVSYANSATPPTGGTRDVSLTSLVEETSGGDKSTKPQTGIGSPVAVNGSTLSPGSGSDLFDNINLDAPAAGNSVKSMQLDLTGIKDGATEIITINGQQVPLVPGTTTVNGVTYTVALDASGTGTLTITDNTAPGWSEAQAEDIVNNIGYHNTDTTPTPGERSIAINSNSITQASDSDWAATSPLAVPAAASTPATITTATPGTPSTPMAGADLPAVPGGSSVDALTFTVSGVKNGASEHLTIGGTQVPLVDGTTITNASGTHTVVVDANGTATVVFTPASNLTEAQAETLVSGTQYNNTAPTATGGTREINLAMVLEGNDGATKSVVPVSNIGAPVQVIGGTTTATPAAQTDLFTLAAAQTAIVAPTAPNDVIQTLSFAVSGIKDGAKEVFNINGVEVPLVPGSSTTIGGVTYTVSGTAPDNLTVAVYKPAGFTEAQAEALVDGASLSNTASPATAGTRTVSLVSVTEADATPLVNGAATPAGTPTTVTGLTSSISTAGSGTTVSPLAGKLVPDADVPDGSTVDTLTFTVTGVKDGNAEVLTFGTAPNTTQVPLVPGTVTSTTDPVGSYVVTVDANGTATVVFTPTTNLTEAEANTLLSGSTYTNSANPPTAGERTVAVTSMGVDNGTTVTPTPVTTVTSAPINVSGSTSIDAFENSDVLPDLGTKTVDSISFGVSGVKDGASEILVINGKPIPLVNGSSTNANGSYTVTVDANGNATVVFTPASNLSETQANAVLDGASYTNKASPATDGARDLSVNSVVAEDGSGNQSTIATPGLVTTVFQGTVTNTAPQVTVNTGLTANEGLTATLTASQLAAIDAQQTAGSLTFTLTDAPDHGTLFRDTNGNGLVNTGEAIAAGGTFTQSEITGGKIKYRHDSSETASDQLSFTVSDGTATTVAMPFVMTINPVNDVPTLTATAANPAFTEATTPSPVALFTAVTAGTGDTLGTAQKLTSLTLTVSNIADGASEKLLVNGDASGNEIELSGNTANGNVGAINSSNLTYTVSKSGTTATVTLTHAGLTPTELKTLVEGLKYVNTSSNATDGARAVNITRLVDDGSSNSPNLNTAILSLGSTVTVTATNNPPTLAIGSNGTNPAGFTIVEGGAQTLNTTHLAATDSDSASSSFVYKLTTAPSASGLLYIDNNGNAVNDTGDTTLALDNTFTQAELTGGKVRFQHAGGEASTETMAFSVSDGTSSSDPATLTVTLTPVNDAPTLGGLDGDTITYPPQDPPMLIDKDSNATVTDPDSNDFAGGTLRVSVFFNGDASKDVLSIKNVGTGSGQINVASGTVSYGSTAIGTFTGGSSGADLVVTLNASATAAATEALISALQFYNSDAAPANNSRGIRISLSDGDGGTSLASQVQINIPVGGPGFVSGSGFFVSENTTLVTIMAATDATDKLPITYSISPTIGDNADAAKFTIDATTGTLSFVAAPDYETPTDAGGNNVYNVVVRASNKELAYSEAALSVNVVNVVNESSGATPGDTAGPVFGFATVNGTTLTMTYTDASNLDGTNTPLPSAFAVSGNTVTAVTINPTAKTVTLTLGTAVTAGQTVTVSYNDPTGGNDVNALQDAAGNDAATLTNAPVSNLTVPPPSSGGGGGGGGGGTTPPPTVPTDPPITDDNIPPPDEWDDLPDDDGDGVPEEIENLVPSLPPPNGGTPVVGDGNGDGIADQEQTDVASIPFRNTDTVSQNPSAPVVFVTLVAGSEDGTPDGEGTITTARQLDAPPDLPPDLNLPLGLISFTATTTNPGAPKSFSLFVPSDLEINGYWKPTASGWVNLASPEYGGQIVTVGDKTRLDFVIEDNGPFDTNPAPGIIGDPGGPGFMEVDTPPPGNDCPYDPFKPDADGDGMPDAIERQLGFNPAVKDNNVFDSNTLFARQLYRDILGREGDASGVSHWAQTLASGQTRADLVAAFIDGAEFDLNGGAIARLYHATLGRSPDFCGFNYWLTQSLDGLSAEQMGDAFLQSPEFIGSNPDLTNEEFVDLLYLNVLGREADPDGKTYWLAQMAQGMSRGSVLYEFAQSEEYKTSLEDEVAIDMLYLGLLDRAPDQGGWDFWHGQYTQYDSTADFYDAALQQTEYHDRFLPAEVEPVSLTGVTAATGLVDL